MSADTGYTPCPVPGIDDTEQPNWWEPAAGAVPGQAAALKSKRGLLLVYPPGSSGVCEGSPLSLPLKPSTTLHTVYDTVAKHYGLTGKSWVLCHRSSGEVVALEDLLSSLQGDNRDVVACVDASKTPDEGLLSRRVPLPSGPPPRLLGKNADDLFLPNIMVAHLRLMREYGPVFRLVLPGKEGGEAVFVADPDLIEQVVSSPEVWQKLHMKHATLVRGFVGDGLFTSDDDEEIWGTAHRILLPAFSNNGMKNYFNDVMHCTDLLFNEWERVLCSGLPLDMTSWAEHFTFDVIGRVAFATDFQAIANGTHPYLERLVVGGDAMETLRSYSFLSKVVFGGPLGRKFLASNKGNVDMVDEMIKQRKLELSRGEFVDRKDLLTLMLTAKDPKSGHTLPDDNVRNQILTFLFAGHDSTSTALTTLLLNIAQHGTVEHKLYEEVMRVVGEGPLTYDMLGKLSYTTQVINESMRLYPPAQAIRKQCVESTELGPYSVPRDTSVLMSLWALAHNPHVWPDPWRFDPDRWSIANSQGRSPFASMPFSFGPRGCLGRQLSLMEQRVLIARTVQRYHVRLHARAAPRLAAPLFLKPHGVLLTLQPRASSSSSSSAPAPAPVSPTKPSATTQKDKDSSGTARASSLPGDARLCVLYGSNMGTGEAFAKDIANQASSLGLVSVVLPLDDILTQPHTLKQSSGVLVVCSTYNGTPPDNAANFLRLATSSPSELSSLFAGVRFAVFGCGNSQWARTYQRVPQLIDQALHQAGGVRLCGFVGGDADGALEESLEQWKKEAWTALLQQLLGVDAQGVSGSAPLSAGLVKVYDVTPCTWDPNNNSREQIASDFAKANGLSTATLLRNNELQDVSLTGRSTRHVELSLPSGVSYRAGDHLAVYGGNPPEVVSVALSLLGVGSEDGVKLSLTSPTRAPTNPLSLNVSLRVGMLLTWGVELQLPASRQQVSHLVELCNCPPEKKDLQGLLLDYEGLVLKPRVTVLELLHKHKSISVDLSLLLSLLPPLKPRYYSISSSPLASPTSVSVTVGHVHGNSPTGREHWGVASSFLNRAKEGGVVRVFVKDTKSAFRLPNDPNTPIILVGPGTGLAPLRGFLLDREASGAQGDTVLFFGCRNDGDHLYKEEMTHWVDKKILKSLHVAYSRKPGVPKTYVQELIRAEASSLSPLFDKGAHVYVCGDAKHMAPDVREAFAYVLGGSKGIEEGRSKLEALLADNRYHEDVWAS